MKVKWPFDAGCIIEYGAEKGCNMKNILVPLVGFENDARALDATFLIAERFQSYISGLRVHPGPMTIVTQAAVQQFGSKMGNVELIHTLQKEAEARSKSAAAAFEAFLKRRLPPGAARSAGAGVNAAFRQIEGDPIDDTVAGARFYDLVVLARAPQNGQFSVDAMANILVGCGRPVLLVPDAPVHSIGTTVAIAWKETAEAARALTAAMPLLSGAKRIVVLATTENDADDDQATQSADLLASQLRHHGLSVESRRVPSDRKSVPEALLEAARESDADLLVMGAYSHSRMREFVFGGFTRHVLKECPLPVFLLH